MGFVSWVGGLFTRAGRTLVGAVESTVHALQILWHLLSTVGHNVGRAWHLLYVAADDLAGLVSALGHATYNAVRKLVTVTIPNAIRNTLAAAIREAGKLAATVKAWAVSAYRAALSFASRIVAELRSWTTSAVRWLTGLIAELRATLATVTRLVGSLLTNPEAMVAWILAPLIRALLRYAVASAEAIARLLLRSAVRIIMRSVPAIEAVLADLL